MQIIDALNAAHIALWRYTAVFLVFLALSCISLKGEARGLRDLQAIPTAPSQNRPQITHPLQRDTTNDSATTDLERLLNNSRLMIEARRRADALSLSETPSAQGTAILLRSRPLPTRQRVEEALNQLLDSWGTPQLAAHLASDFYDANRLSHQITNQIPTDAKLELLRLEDFQIVDDALITTTAQQQARVWLVIADAITQVELNDPVAGFVSLRGRQRFTLRLFDLATDLSSSATFIPEIAR